VQVAAGTSAVVGFHGDLADLMPSNVASMGQSQSGRDDGASRSLGILNGTKIYDALERRFLALVARAR
jgi:hypothetical protein